MPSIQPPPASLYTLEQLTSGFDTADYTSVLRTLSFRQYQAYYPLKVSNASDLPRLRDASDHDANISKFLGEYLQATGLRPVGVMGGHSVSRAEPAYRTIALLTRELTRAGFLVVTGGGPGIMEAAHVGAYFAFSPSAEFTVALDSLAASRHPAIPKPSLGAKLLNDDGTLTTDGDPTYARGLFEWYLDAEQVRQSCSTQPPPSLAVSTWEYGEEPVMSFATSYAAYFQNSIREASLVREARAGIVYAKGGGGTIREIFQDVEENYYVTKTESFTPMVFCDPSNFWSPANPSADTLKLDDTVARIFTRAFARYPIGQIGWNQKVIFTTDTATILNLISTHETATRPMFTRLLQSIA